MTTLQMALQRLGDNNIVPLLLLIVYLCVIMSVMLMLFVEVCSTIIFLIKLFVEVSRAMVDVYRFIILFLKLVKLFRKREVEVHIPIYNEEEAIDRVNAVLERKFEEVESRIGRLLEHPPSTYIHDDNDEVSLYRTVQKVNFIKNLLTAEMNARSPHRQENLNLMATRLSILEEAFVNWTSRFANGVESGPIVNCPDTSAWVVDEEFDGRGSDREKKEAMRKGKAKVIEVPDTSASGSCSFTKSCVVDEEFDWRGYGREKKEAVSKEVENVGEMKQETVQFVFGAKKKEKTVGEVRTETTIEEKAEEESKDEGIGEKKLGRRRKRKEEMTARREMTARFQKAEEGRKRKQQCCQCWAAAIAGFMAGFMIALALSKIPFRAVEETDYFFVPT